MRTLYAISFVLAATTSLLQQVTNKRGPDSCQAWAGAADRRQTWLPLPANQRSVPDAAWSVATLTKVIATKVY